MRTGAIRALALLSASVLGASGCRSDAVNGEVELVSAHGTTKSHFPDTNCMACHQRDDRTSPGRNTLGFFTLADVVACGTPIGLFLGRLANFINGELWGRVTDVPWAMIFPNPAAGGLPRHPSQLYEAGLEGLALFILMHVCSRSQRIREATGTLSGIFLIGYGFARSFSEFFREPEVNLGANAVTTWGQILCIPMILFGIYLVMRGRKLAAKPKEIRS